MTYEITLAKGVKADISDWAKWLAQDQNGRWYVYDNKPPLGVTQWFGVTRWLQVGETTRPKNFTQQLYKIIRR